jgi:aspartyl-tRNA synthetase
MISNPCQKADHKAAENTGNENAEETSDDYSKDKYGFPKMIQSGERHEERNFVAVSELSGSVGKAPVWVRARIHTSRCKGKQCFLVLRQQSSTVQVLISVNDIVSKQMVKFSGS